MIKEVGKGNPMAKSKVLIVDDIPSFLAETSAMLRETGYEPLTCNDPRLAAGRVSSDQPDLLVTTLVMKHLDGFGVIRRVRGQGSQLPIITITGYGSEQAEREAIRLGCRDYLNKPIAAAELALRVGRVLEQTDQTADTLRLGRMVSADPAMRSIVDTVDRVAASRSRVLILGETGTGKQLIAQGIHARSPQADEPFVEVNCAAIPENLLESELFGHRRGAFTDASSDRVGRFEQAGDGTIFLDEIGEMPMGLQAKLLQVLENGHYTRLGDVKTRHSTARVIAATNRDLQEEAEKGRFRTDLYYRLNVVALTVPALRDRAGDIPLLVNHFIQQFSHHTPPITITDEVTRAMRAYHWPGNVRELQNMIERLAVLKPGEEIRLEHLPSRLYMNGSAGAPGQTLLEGSFHDAKRRFEYAYAEHAIRSAGGNFAAAARTAGLDRSQFYRLAQRHGLTGK